MKISTKGRYALRMMIEFAMNDTGEYTKINQVAKSQDISEKYLEQIVTILSRAGFVKSSRGSQGGYKLAWPAKEYTVGMILRLTEGSLAPVPCMEDSPNLCSRSDICSTLYVWNQLAEAIDGVVDGITLADLVEIQRECSRQHDQENPGDCQQHAEEGAKQENQEDRR